MLTLEQAWDLEARLQQRGYTVIMTRETDTRSMSREGRERRRPHRRSRSTSSNQNKVLDELQARINICNAANADLFSLDAYQRVLNSGPHGFETWFTRERPFGTGTRFLPRWRMHI